MRFAWVGKSRGRRARVHESRDLSERRRIFYPPEARMREAEKSGRRGSKTGIRIRGAAAAGALVVALAVAGCAHGPAAKDKLATAYKEFDLPNPNYSQVADAADAYLKEQPAGPAAADALYLRGRALEAKGQADASSPEKDFSDAYGYYEQALAQNPRPALAGLIHIGMANIRYFQGRYSAA